MAAAHNQASEWAAGCTSATNALELDPTNVKALYRRGLARARLELFDGAKEDLTACVKTDPKNRDARTELTAVKERLAKRKESGQQKLADMFAQEGDKKHKQEEVEKVQKKAAEAKERRKKEMEEMKEDARLRGEWMAGCMGESANIDFETFKKQRQEEDWQKREAEEAAAKRRQQREEEERFKARQRNDVVSVEDDDDLTGVIRGYKKRADGSTTSYFDRELDDAAKGLLTAKPQPVRIDPSATQEAAGTEGSAWNHLGTTWEDKDMSGWASSWLKTELANTSVELKADGTGGEPGETEGSPAPTAGTSTTTAKVKEVKKVEGHANIAMVRKSKRYMYDYHLELAWEAEVEQVPSASGDEEASDGADESEEKKKKPETYQGTVVFADVSSTVDGEDFEAAVTHKATTGRHQAQVEAAVQKLVAETKSKLATFVAELKAK